MIGFITDSATASAILDGIRSAQEGRGLAHYWTTGAFLIHSGAHATKVFIPASDSVLSTPLRDGLTPRDFPEFGQLLAMLGGLDARQEIDPQDIMNPDSELG